VYWQDTFNFWNDTYETWDEETEKGNDKKNNPLESHRWSFADTRLTTWKRLVCRSQHHCKSWYLAVKRRLTRHLKTVMTLYTLASVLLYSPTTFDFLIIFILIKILNRPLVNLITSKKTLMKKKTLNDNFKNFTFKNNLIILMYF
jgi:hypothetical protein